MFINPYLPWGCFASVGTAYWAYWGCRPGEVVAYTPFQRPLGGRWGGGGVNWKNIGVKVFNNDPRYIRGSSFTRSFTGKQQGRYTAHLEGEMVPSLAATAEDGTGMYT